MAKIGSDIDIAIVIEKNISNELIINNIVNEINQTFGIEIQVHYFSKEEFKSSKSDLIEEIKNDEIILIS